MADLVYPPILLVARSLWGALGIRFLVSGGRNVPRQGGAVLASNHVSLLDFTFVGLAGRPSKRLVRFMAKKEVFDHPVTGPLMRGMHHVPVDRAAGAAAFDRGVADLHRGEVIGIFPEATISRSWELREFKAGAARMAITAQVPLIPMALWGGQRILTKARKPDLTRGRAVGLAVGAPMHPKPDADPVAVTAELKQRIRDLLDGLQKGYPHQPDDESDRWWLPRALGGTAPTLEEADALDAEEAAEKLRRRSA